jgi:hypothetical protein
MLREIDGGSGKGRGGLLHGPIEVHWIRRQAGPFADLNQNARN